MTKIRCGDNMGIDLDQVIAWSKGKVRLALKPNEFLHLYLAGIDKPVSVAQDEIGCQAFAYLHKLLLDRFAIDLAGKSNLLCQDDDSSVQDEPLELPF